jgi:hypothetical protein
MSTIRCKGCDWPKMTWSEQRFQFARVMSAGLTAGEAKTLMRCGKCTTEAMRARGLKGQQRPRRVTLR